MPDHIDDARQLIESRLAEIGAEASRLERAVASMGEGTARKRRRGRPRKSTTVVAAPPRRHRVHANAAKPKRPTAPKRKTAKRAARGQRLAELLAAIEAKPGARPSELAKEIGVRPTQVSVLLAKARAEKLIVKCGDGYAPKA